MPATAPKPTPAATLPQTANPLPSARPAPPHRILTPAQTHLARHALGLPNHRHVSYRNRFHAPRNTPAYDDWRAMTDAGYAWRIPWQTSYGDLFTLTRPGAEAALSPAERLDDEDFPPL